MKKLSKVQRKQQAAVMAVATDIENQAFVELAGLKECWFDMDYDNFPSSLLVRLAFKTESEKETAQPQLLHWQKKLSAALLKKGIRLKNMRLHLVFTCADDE